MQYNQPPTTLVRGNKRGYRDQKKTSILVFVSDNYRPKMKQVSEKKQKGKKKERKDAFVGAARSEPHVEKAYYIVSIPYY